MSTRSATRQTLLAKEGLAVILALAALGLAGALYPLGPVTSGDAAGSARAPWLFLGLQELLRLMPAVWGGLAIPLGAVLLLALLPWLGRGSGPALPRWRRGWRAAELLAWLVAGGWAALTLVALWRH